MANYSIDGTDLTTFGLQVKELKGVYDVPERKGKTEVDNPILGGVVPLTGAYDIYVKERTIEVICYLFATSPQDALSKMTSLQNLLYSPGTRTLASTYSSETWTCFCKDGAKTKRLTRIGESQQIYEVTIKLVEINPRRV